MMPTTIDASGKYLFTLFSSNIIDDSFAVVSWEAVGWAIILLDTIAVKQDNASIHINNNPKDRVTLFVLCNLRCGG
jgi:hypothetical protein